MRPGYRIFLAALCVAVMSSVSWGASISGTVTNNTGNAGSRIYLSVSSQFGGDTGLGVSIPTPGPNASASYMIRGVPDGSYVVNAFLDSRGNGNSTKTSATRHSNDPFGSTPSPVSIVAGGDVTGANITLSPPAGSPLQAPSLKGVMTAHGGALVNWGTPKDNNGYELAYSYNLYWHTASSVSSTTNTGKKTGIPANGNGMYIQTMLDPTTSTPLADGTQLWYVVEAQRGQSGQPGFQVAPSAAYGPVTIGAIPSNHTTTFNVSGTVTLDGGITPAGPLFVAAVNNGNGAYITSIAAPGASNPFTVTGVPSGNYQLFAILDQNNDGIMWAGDYQVTDKLAPMFSVTGADVAGVTVNVPKLDVVASLSTTHSLDAIGQEGYNLNFDVRQAFQLPVNASIRVGSGIAEPTDLAVKPNEGGISYWLGGIARPVVGTQYTIDLGYADGSTGVIPLGITAVLDSFPEPVSPKGNVAFNATPTFSWTAPSIPPVGGYTYNLSLNGNNIWWNTDTLPSSQTSALFNFDNNANGPLSNNAAYSWEIAVSDMNGNQASKAATFFSGGSISGRVTDAVTSAGVAGINVQLYDSNGNFIPNYWGTVTDGSGNYVMGGLSSNTYRVCFQPQDPQSGYIGVCYGSQTNDPHSATNIQVNNSLDTPNINASLTKGVSISGTVTASGGGPIQGVTVELHDVNGNWIMGFNQTQTSGSGSYTLNGLQPGSYKLYFNGSSQGYIGQWYDNKNDSASAATITLAAGQNQVANATLVHGGSITGKVSIQGSSTGIQGINVNLYDQNGNWIPSNGNMQTGADGTYSIGGLQNGTYKVCFNSGSTNYIGKCYNNLDNNPMNATPILVTAPGTSTGIDAALVAGGTISGQVTNGTSGIQWVNVQLRDTNGNWVSNVPGTSTDQNGNYTLGGIPASPVGGYKVFFDGSNNGYVGRWYNGASGTTDLGSATALTIAPGDSKTNIGAALSHGASISGQVTDAANPVFGIAGINVRIYDGNGGNIPNNGGTNTDGSGNYSIGGLADGNYKVCFESGITSYLGKCYNNLALDPANATPITIAGGINATGKNASLVLGATITGRVTSGGAGVQNINASVRDTNGNWIPNIWSSPTNANGDYTIRAIPAGTYKVFFDTNGTSYGSQWYNGKSSVGAADPITLTNGQTRTGVDAALAQVGSISGVVTGASGLSINVTAYDGGGNWAGSTVTSNGIYTITGLPSGSYKVNIDGSMYGYESKWYLNSADMAGGTSISVTAPATTNVSTVNLVRLYNLNVSNFMNGGFGTITDNLGKISCGALCNNSYPQGTVVTLTATPDANSVFTGWSGGICTGNAPCQVTMNQSTNVTANYSIKQYTLTVSKSGTGGGTVNDNYAMISCGAACSNSYGSGSSVTLNASPDANSVFAGWSGGACTGTGSCIVNMNAAKSVTATFNLAGYVKNGMNSYASLQSAFDAATNLDTIMAQAQVFTSSNLIFDRTGAVIKFKGGYDGAYLTNGGFSTVSGKLSIRNGTLQVENLKIM